MIPRRERRWSFDPVIPYIEQRWRHPGVRCTNTTLAGKTAQVLGCNRAQVYRWEQNGLNCRSADRVAVALGMHPAMLWPDWLEDVEVCPECPVECATWLRRVALDHSHALREAAA